MKFINKIKIASLLVLSGAGLLTACNKGLEQIQGTTPVSIILPGSGSALGDTLKSSARANDSLYFKIILKSGLLATLNNKANEYTVFIPTNAAVRRFVTAITGGAVPAAAPDAVFRPSFGSVSRICRLAEFSTSTPGTLPLVERTAG